MIFINIGITLLAVASEFNYATASQLRMLKSDKAEKSEKGPKAEKSEKGPEAETSEKGTKASKSEKGYKGDKGDKGNKTSKSSKCDGVFSTRKPPSGNNICAGKKVPLDNIDCYIDAISGLKIVNPKFALGGTGEQAGANVTQGYNGSLNVTSVPITNPYWTEGMCAVNVHWHLGTEHLSVGEYDENGSGPSEKDGHRKLVGDVRPGYQCHHYNGNDSKFTKTYKWEHCKDMHVGETYEVHWPHSNVGACATPNQFQTPFYDGVFCNFEDLNVTKIGVQSQVFTIVNDESYYYPDLMNGMIVEGDKGTNKAIYTGSTTGTSRNNTVCSQYTPITWQVDRKCHMISASTFDKMCADMKSQRDDMSNDIHPHGSRELVDDELAANNHATR